MGGKKKQETNSSLRSTSGRRDSVSPAAGGGHQTQHHAKTVNVGCMSGIFHLISKYHTRRKFLTFGKKQERQVSSPAKPETTTTVTGQPRKDENSAARSSLEVPRSPVIPAEIRSSGSANSPRVVARLMGIEDAPASPLASVAAEKRRKLLGALEKCDEDLKALKRIIDAVRATQTPPRATVVVADGGGRKTEKRGKGMEAEGEEEEREEGPSPVSVLDYHNRSPPLTGYSKRTPYGQLQEMQKGIRKLKPAEEYNPSFHILNRSTPPSVVNITSLTSVYLPAKTRPPVINVARASTLPWSKAVVETVEEVCRDVQWGQTREVERIGLLIQDFVLKDLVEEITMEMMMMRRRRMRRRTNSCDHVFGTSRIVSFPFEVSKRKLCF